jgi:hypothetical protein
LQPVATKPSTESTWSTESNPGDHPEYQKKDVEASDGTEDAPEGRPVGYEKKRVEGCGGKDNGSEGPAVGDRIPLEEGQEDRKKTMLS